jgi:hypothetical protein
MTIHLFSQVNLKSLIIPHPSFADAKATLSHKWERERERTKICSLFRHIESFLWISKNSF